MVKGGDLYYGLLQAFADALKLLLKEYVSPTQANIILFFLGPIITLIFSLLGYAVIPYGAGLALWDFNLGILYMLAVSSLATYGILLAGLVDSPLITRVISEKLGEFQETLSISQLEAKHDLIFLTYLVVLIAIIRYALVFIIFIVDTGLNFERSTTSRCDSRKIYNSATSAQNLRKIYINGPSLNGTTALNFGFFIKKKSCRTFK